MVGFNYSSVQIFVVKSFLSILPLGKKQSNNSVVLLLQKHLSDSQRLADSMFFYEISNPYFQFIDRENRLGTRLALKDTSE